MHYRVRLLQQPIIVYSGHCYALAAQCMDSVEEHDRVLEQRLEDGWHSIISVELGT